jgi:hypothetical protein
MKFRFGEWFALLFVVAIIYVLVRPSSNAAQLVAAVGTFGRALLRNATDLANR